MVHRLVGMAFWLLLAGMWATILDDDRIGSRQILDSIAYIAMIAGAVLAVTLYWIAHNVAIHRRKGPRTGRPLIAPRVDVDRLGRPLRWSLPGGAAGAACEPHLIVEVEDGVKVYRRA